MVSIMGVQMNVSFYDRKGINSVSIEDGNALFDEPIEKISPNGRYCVASGYWYINDENSENDGDEIDGSAETIVFENGEILYRAKSIEDAEDYVIRDDGKLCVFEDDGVTIWSALAKPITKKFSFSWFDFGVNADFAWASGDDEDGNLRLSVFIFDTGKMWTKRLSANICNIKAVLMVKDSQSSICAVAETHDDEDIVIQYDLDGKKQELSKENLQKVLMAIAQCEPEPALSKQMPDEENPPTASEPKKKLPLWVIILAVAILILALIGKYVAQ